VQTYGTRRSTPASQGNSRHCPSRGGGVHWREGPEPCLVSLAECRGRVWWFTPSCPDFSVIPHAASVLFSLEAH